MCRRVIHRVRAGNGDTVLPREPGSPHTVLNCTLEEGRMRLTRSRLLVATVVPATLAAAIGTLAVTAHAAAAGCNVTYTVSSQWPGGFGATVNLTNLGDPLTGWTLTWSYNAGQQVTQAWNATVAQNGSQVTARNVSWNGTLATNASASFGFNGSWTGSNPTPTTFALNGVTCTGATTPPTTTPTTSPTTGGPQPAHSMGFIGCSMAENVAQGYVADGGTRMWGPY